MLIWRGVVIALTGGFPITVRDSARRSRMRCPGRCSTGSACRCCGSSPSARLGTFLLTRTRFGNWVQARGQNEQAARNLGVPVDRVTIILFMLDLGARRLLRRRPGGALLLGRCAARRGHGVAGRRGHGDRRHAALRRLRQRDRHDPGLDHVRHDPGRPRARRRAGAFLPHADGRHRRRRGDPEHRVARRMARSKPLAGFRRSSAADAAIAGRSRAAAGERRRRCRRARRG